MLDMIENVVSFGNWGVTTLFFLFLLIRAFDLISAKLKGW